MNHQLRKSEKRLGFTLLELLMVVAIIGILMSLSVVVMLGFIDQAEEEATSATIQKLGRLVEQRSEAFDRAFKGAVKQRTVTAMQGLLVDPNQDGNRADGIFGVYESEVEILAKKALFRFQMPQRFEERLLFGDAAVTVSGMPESIFLAVAGPNARQYLLNENAKLATPNPAFVPSASQITDLATARWVGGSVTITFGGPASPATKTFTFTGNQSVTESIELLYFTLTASGSYGATSVDVDRFTPAEIQDTDDDGLPEFIDAWGQPLRFYRWPTRLVDWNPPIPFQPVLADPNDPTDVVVTVDTDSDGIPDTTIGQRAITPDERAVANILLKGLPPAPSLLPNGVLPRDLLLTDPDDPIGILYSALERLDGNNGSSLLRVQFNEANYHTPDTFHAPVIVSAGADETLGLYEPNDTANLGNLAAYNADLNGNSTPGEPADFAALLDVISDNLTSRNKLAGGR